MVYQPHVRITFIGTLGVTGAGVETWSFNLALDRASDLSQAENDNVAAALVAYLPRATSHIDETVKSTLVKSALIGADGHYVNNFPVISAAVAQGHVGVAHHPPQVAYAVSLGTTARRIRGRYYVPMPSVAVDTTSLEMAAADQSDMLASARTFLNAVSVAAGSSSGFSGGVCVASRVGAGNNALVTSCRVGRAFDTIRSRRRSLVENYATQTLP